MSYTIPQPPKADPDIPIPPDFLTGPPPGPINAVPIPFASSPIPEYQGRTALTIDNVLSREECAQLIALAESSVAQGAADDPDSDSSSPWKPALVRVAPGVEVAPSPGYRESGRIVCFSQEVVDRVWKRCVLAEGLAEQMAVVQEQQQRGSKVRLGEWRFRRVNNRMSFLRYEKGQYFKPHCDGPYYYDVGKTEFQTHYTLQLYLNDSAEASGGTGEELVGGATAFLSRDKKRRVNVNPKAGGVLIFQHEGLLHEGAEVKAGVKYTMRTDILYEWVLDAPARK
ncbi:hypothetical protein ACO1O0_004915 [Amphichorda felina]